MARNVTIVFVHGIQTQDINFSLPMQKRLTKAIPKQLRAHLRFKEVLWADIVRFRSQQYLRHAHAITDIVDNEYRRLVVEGLGDAAAYQKTRHRENSAYYQIQDRLTAALKDSDVAEDPSCPLILVGHSLGSHIVSSYAWDINRLKQLSASELESWGDPGAHEFAAELATASPFRRLDTFAGIITMGSNIPLFTFTFGPDRVYPITKFPYPGRLPAFPGKALTGTSLKSARWLNFYSRNDILGFPLKPLNPAYSEEKRLMDIEVYSEGYLRAMLLPPQFNILQSHTGYWTNRTVISESAKLICDIITADGDSGHMRSRYRAAKVLNAAPEWLVSPLPRGCRHKETGQFRGSRPLVPIRPRPQVEGEARTA